MPEIHHNEEYYAKYDEHRAIIHQAICDFTEFVAANHDDAGTFVTGWSTGIEFLSADSVEQKQHGDLYIEMDNQSPGTSRGIYMGGVDKFTLVHARGSHDHG